MWNVSSGYNDIRVIAERFLEKKSLNIWKLNTLQDNSWIKNKKIKKEIERYFEMNENENSTYQNLWDSDKAVHKGKCIELNAFIKKRIKFSNQWPQVAPK